MPPRLALVAVAEFAGWNFSRAGQLVLGGRHTEPKRYSLDAVAGTGVGDDEPPLPLG